MSSTSNSTYKSTHPFHDFLKVHLKRVGHTTSYDIYLRDRNDSLREWVQGQMAYCPDISEKEYVCWAINEYGTLETAKENLVPDWLVSEISPAIIRFDPEKESEPLGLIGGKPYQKNQHTVKYCSLDKGLVLRVWLHDPAEPCAGCCFDFVNDKHEVIGRPQQMVIETLDGMMPGAKVFPIGEAFGQGKRANLNVHSSHGTHLISSGTTLRFTHPNFRHPVDVRLPEYLRIHHELHNVHIM